MSKINDFLAQKKAESDAFWTKTLKGAKPATPTSSAEAKARFMALASKAPQQPPRDLAAEQEELRDLLQQLPWLKLRKIAAELGVPSTTLDAYLAAVDDTRYRPLRDINHADTLWIVLRDTMRYIQVALPEHISQKLDATLPQDLA